MKLKLDEEMRAHLKDLLNESKTEEEWNEVCAGDWFQSAHYCGGFESPEDGFTFSYYDSNNVQYWFEFPLSAVSDILNAKEFYFDAVVADTN